MQTLEIIRHIARAQFRPMTRNERMGFLGAPDDATIADLHDVDVIVIRANDEDTGAEYYEVHQNEDPDTGEHRCWRVDLTTLI